MNNTDTNNKMAREWELIESSRALRAAKAHIPLTATFELTPLCTMDCKMCYIRLSREERDSRGRELTTDQWLSLARETIRMGTLNLLLTGGEAMLRPDFAELYTELAHMGFLITLNTNATLMTPRMIDLFSKYPPTGVDVTMYGASAQTYEKICGDGSMFQRTLNGLEALSSLPTRLQVRVTFVRDNKDEYNAIHEIANKYTSMFAINLLATQPNRGADKDISEIRLKPEDLFIVDATANEYYRKRAIEKGDADGDKKTHEELIGEDRIALENEMVSMLHKIEPTLLQCSAAKSAYAISWDGKMLPCLTFSNPYTLPLEEGLEPAWKRLIELYTNIPACEKCKTCEDREYCQCCPGYLQSETGKLDCIAPYLCEISRFRRLGHEQYIKNNLKKEYQL